MGLLDNILSSIDAKKRTFKRSIMDMLDNPGDWSNMTAARMKENLYGSPENWDAMKRYYQQQPYDQKLKDAGQQSMINNAVNESLGAIFVGKGAKTWDKMKEADALARLAKGEDAATVWKETGVAVAPWDNAARTEISDHTAKLTPISELVKQRNADLIAQRDKIIANVKEAGRSPTDFEKAHVNQLNELIQTSAYRGTVGDALDHPELFAAHPQLKRQDLRWREMPVSDKGSWDQNSGMMLNQGLFGNDAKSIVLHEGQHASQDYSKLSPGGSPAAIAKNPQNYVHPDVIEYAKSLPAYSKNDPEEFIKSFSAMSIGDPYEAYRKLGGEAESRLTQYRMNLTPEARAALYPYDPAYFKQATGVDIDKLITRGLLDDGPAMSVAPKLTEFEQRHLTAQKNAALPVEQGGLGLPPNNTAMDRARSMGAVDAYHGSPNEIIGQSFNRKSAGVTPTNTFDSADANVFASSSPTVASEYAQIGKTSRNPYDEFYSLPVDKRNELIPLFNKIVGKDASRDDVYNILKSITQSGNKEGAYGELAKQLGVVDNVSENVMPLMIMGKAHTVDWKNTPWRETEMQRKISEAKQSGADYLLNKNIIDSMSGAGVADSFAVLNPSSVRSRFAAFDPKRRHEADLLGYADPYLLGAMGAGGLLGLGGYSMMNDK